MKVVFYTPRNLRPMHPRLLSFRRYFEQLGITPEFINHSNYTPTLYSRLSWLFLWLFDLEAIRRCKATVGLYDIVVITDLKYLRLARYAKQLGKVVIYDTIDHNIHLRYFQLQQRFPFLRLFKRMLLARFEKLERRYAKFCDEILVNSNSLHDYFGGRSHLALYSSPFESTLSTNDAARPSALLYLGAFTEDKGASEIMALQKSLALPLFIFGNAETGSLPVHLPDNVIHTPKLSAVELAGKLSDLQRSYFLFGFSLIRSAHYSYEVQEANKDIDYLCLGIPLLGNTRKPTLEKIKAGCGILSSDPSLATKLHDAQARLEMQQACVGYYNRNYSQKHFEQAVDAALKKHLRS